MVLLGRDEVSVLLMSGVWGHSSLSEADSFDESRDSRAEALRPTGPHRDTDSRVGKTHWDVALLQAYELKMRIQCVSHLFRSVPSAGTH